MGPEGFIEKFADVDRCNTKYGELFAAFDPCDFAGPDFLTRVDVIDQ